MNRTSKKILAVGLPLTVVAATGIAVAAWDTSGTGTGYGKALGASAVATQLPGSLTADLYPGGPAGAVTVDVTNPNPYPVTVTAISLSDAVVADASAGCTKANFTLDTSKGFSGSQVVPAHTGSTDGHFAFTIAGALSMNATAPKECESVTVPVTLNNTAGNKAITAAVGS